jgi:uncharacterized peroxidase-related enzyme
MEHQMAYIQTTSEQDVAGDARAMYEHQTARNGYVPNYAKVFCHRPEVMRSWAQLLAAIKTPMGKRRFELATFAAAIALRSSLCSLAHGHALMEFFSTEDVLKLARGETPESLAPAEAALVEFARRVALDASSVTRPDVERLRSHGFDDAEVFDIAAAAAGRAFFTKVIESLGVEPEPRFLALDPEVRDALAVGRPVDFADPARTAA